MDEKNLKDIEIYLIKERKKLISILAVITFFLLIDAVVITGATYLVYLKTQHMEKTAREVKYTIRKYCGSLAGKILQKVIK
jgi:hypothetical protein